MGDQKGQCIAKALAGGAATVAIDSVGLIPEAGGALTAARRLGNMRGYRGIMADQFGGRAIRQSQDMAGGFGFAQGLGDKDALGTGFAVAGFIPGVEQIAALGSMGYDAYKIYKAIKQCQ